MSNQKKNVQIEASNDSVEMNQKDADEAWKILKDAIHEMYNHNYSLDIKELSRFAF